VSADRHESYIAVSDKYLDYFHMLCQVHAMRDTDGLVRDFWFAIYSTTKYNIFS
jgi:hypothetical protein